MLNLQLMLNDFRLNMESYLQGLRFLIFQSLRFGLLATPERSGISTPIPRGIFLVGVPFFMSLKKFSGFYLLPF